jgi:toxin FitB
VLVLGEIRQGVERARRTDAAQARALEKSLSTIKESYGERILPIDQMVADEWGMSTPSCRRLERIHHIGA